MARTKEIIKVSRIDFARWQHFRSHGDIAVIKEHTKYSRKEISDALNLGFCTQELKDAIDKYLSK